MGTMTTIMANKVKNERRSYRSVRNLETVIREQGPNPKLP
jgi:hypothetical protein